MQKKHLVFLIYQKHVGRVKNCPRVLVPPLRGLLRFHRLGIPWLSQTERAKCSGRMCSITPSGSFSRLCWPVSCTCRRDHDGIQQFAACGCGERRRWWREPTQVWCHLSLRHVERSSCYLKGSSLLFSMSMFYPVIVIHILINHITTFVAFILNSDTS